MIISSGLHYSIVKPGTLTDEGSFGKIQLNEKLGKKGSISRTAVAKTLVEVLEDEVNKNQVFEILTGEAPIKKSVRNCLKKIYPAYL